MIYKIKRIIQRKNYQFYTSVIESMMSQKFHYEKIKSYLNLPFDTLHDYLKLISSVQFKSLNDLDQLRFHIGFSAFEKNLKQNVFKQLLYPLFLFVLSFCLTFYFSTSFGPTIHTMLDDFGITKNSLNCILILTHILKYLWFLFFILMGVFALFLLSKDYLFVFYIKFHTHHFCAWARNILTLRFVYVYHFFLERGTTSQFFFDEMSKSSGLDDVKWLGYHLKERLASGASLLDAFDLTYFNEFFIIYLQKGFYNRNLTLALEEYLEILELMIQKQCERFFMIFKIFVYTYVIIFIGIYYVFLFQPLSILEGLV